MTDDEAFVRAVVAAPADEAPRLVYADWLDERGDPRGECLRAEVEWARRRVEHHNKKTRRQVTERLRAASDGLDPVWVARICRPPFGVCLDHVSIQGGGRTLGGASLANLERQIGGILPIAYRAFLLNHNGGIPRRLSAGSAGPHGEPSDSAYGVFGPVTAFLRVGVASQVPAGCEVAETVIAAFHRFLDAGYDRGHNLIPIARSEDAYLAFFRPSDLVPSATSVPPRTCHLSLGLFLPGNPTWQHYQDNPIGLPEFLRYLPVAYPGQVVRPLIDAADIDGLVRWLDGGGDVNATLRPESSSETCSLIEYATKHWRYPILRELLRRGAAVPHWVEFQIQRLNDPETKALLRENRELRHSVEGRTGRPE